MRLRDVIDVLEGIAPPELQESYDNAGLITGNPDWEVTGTLLCLDSTPEVVDEAIAKGCNVVIAHHPIIFRGLKSITGSTYVERAVIKAIKADIAIYAIHTNLDNVLSSGVNGKIARKLGLSDIEVLRPRPGEEGTGSGVIGRLQEAMSPVAFLEHLKKTFQVPVVRHTKLISGNVSRIAVCGGAGQFLLQDAISNGADVFVTADIKYHEFFDADGKILLADVGHYESEQYTVELLGDILRDNFANFAPNSSETITNPVNYYT